MTRRRMEESRKSHIRHEDSLQFEDSFAKTNFFFLLFVLHAFNRSVSNPNGTLMREKLDFKLILIYKNSLEWLILIQCMY